MVNDNPPLPLQYKGVMVSSTFTDLEEHRAALIKAIKGQGFTDVAMENDSAKPDLDVVDSSLKMVRDSSAYIGVISHKYGQTPECPSRNPGNLSITELEFDEAQKLHRPILLFIMGDKHPVIKADVEADPAKTIKLDAFRERAKKMATDSHVHRVYDTFNSLEEFRIKANVAIANLRSYFNDQATFTAQKPHEVAKVLPSNPADSQTNIGQFINNSSDEETFAKAIFGSFSYEKRYHESNSRGHYFPRQIDAKLDERLGRGGWVLVEGHPLAGKTRAIFEAIKRLMFTGRSVALWPFKAPERTGQPLTLPIFPEADYHIVWMDDIDTRFHDLAKRGYGTDEINHYLERIADAGIILAATTRTGPGYYDFRHRFGLNDHVWDKLESFPIHRLEGEEEKGFTAWYVSNFGESLPDKFDHHPGSLFLNLETMGSRWRNMDNLTRELNLKLDVERAKDIMRTLHVFYVMEAYRPGGLFLEEDIRFYLRHKAERQMTTPMGIAITKTQLGYKLPGGEEWERLVEFLSQDKFNLGFLRREGEYLLTETAYLDYIVAPDGEKNIVQTIVENFSEEARVRLGLMVTSYNFGEAFRQSPPKNEKDLEKLVRKLKPLGLDREIKVWNQVLYLCPTLPLVRRGIEMLGNVGLKPDILTYAALITKAEDYATARAVIDEMTSAGVSPNLGTYNKLATKAQDYDTARAVIDEMTAAGIRPSLLTYAILITKARDYDTARAIFGEMTAAGIRPDVFTYATLMTKARDYDTARAIFGEMMAAGISPSLFTYTKLVAKAQDYDTARAVIDEMMAAGISPDVFTYNTQVIKAQDFAMARAIIDEMSTVGISPSIGTYNILVTKAEDYATARAVIDEMTSAGVSPNLGTYNNLATKAQDYDTARAVIDEMTAAGVSPDVFTYAKLITKSRDYTMTRAIIKEMMAAGISPGVLTYNILVTKAEDYATARAVIDEMTSAGVSPNLGTYNNLATKAQDYDTARAVIDEMTAAGIRPSLLTYATLVVGAQDYDTARAIIDKMATVGIRPNKGIYNKLATKAQDYDTARAVIDEMMAAGIRPGRGIYNKLVANARDFVAARAVIKEMTAAGVLPDIITYATLITKAQDEATVRAIIGEMTAAGIQPA